MNWDIARYAHCLGSKAPEDKTSQNNHQFPNMYQLAPCVGRHLDAYTTQDDDDDDARKGVIPLPSRRRRPPTLTSGWLR